MRRAIAVLACATVLVAGACSGDDDADDLDAGSDDSAAAVDGGSDGTDDDPVADGSAPLPGSLQVSGALTESATTDDDGVRFRPGGACLDNVFAMSVKVDLDERTVYDVIVPELAGISSGTTGSFETDIETVWYDPATDSFEGETFTGVGTVEIVGQETLALSYTASGELTSEDDDARVIEVDLAATVAVNC